MKHVNKTLMMLCVTIIALASCKKSEVGATTTLAALNLVNVTVGSTAVKANFTSKTDIFASTSTSVAYGTNNAYSLFAGNATPVVITATADTLHPVYNTPINAAAGSYYSLYLCGQTGAVDAVLMKESFTIHADSTFGVRIVNLSYNSGPINMTLSTTPTTNEISNIAYKSVSAFNNYACKGASPALTFQLRDAVTNALLGSQAFTTATLPRFQNITLVLKGKVGGTGSSALGLLLVKNY